MWNALSGGMGLGDRRRVRVEMPFSDAFSVRDRFDDGPESPESLVSASFDVELEDIARDRLFGTAPGS